MSVVTVSDLHLTPDPERRIARAALLARIDRNEPKRLIVRCPDRQTDGVRVLRENDVAVLLQRHGRIRELAVTDGGTIVAAADVCERRGDVAVWTGYAIGDWHPNDLLDRGLGGSETAAVRLAQELAAMGWAVTLYGQFLRPGLWGDVLIRHFNEFDPTRPLDALIGFRDARLFDHRPNARLCALWLEDLAPAEMLTPTRAGNVDRVCAVSHFHKQQVEGVHPWVRNMTAKYDEKLPLVAACRNGIVTEWFDEGDEPIREKRVVYSSSPDRGGDIMLELWPQIRDQVPDAELILTYPRWFDLVSERFQQAHDLKARIYELLEQPGVHRIEGGLGQKALAHLMRSSLVWAHPSYYTPGEQKFEETSCISAMEAQAAGCVVVASNWGALSETVSHGTLVDGDPHDPEGGWREQFVEAIVRGLTDDNVQTMGQTLGPEYMRDMGWRGAAEQLAAMIPEAERMRANL